MAAKVFLKPPATASSLTGGDPVRRRLSSADRSDTVVPGDARMTLDATATSRKNDR